MNTVPTIKPSWEVPHSLGSILWREARGAYEIRLRIRPREPQHSWYVKGARLPETYATAERKLAAEITAAGRGERPADGTLTVGAWLDLWLEQQIGQKPSTVTAYEQRIALYLKPALGRHKLAELKPATVAAAMARLGSVNRPRPSGSREARTGQLSTGTVDAAFRVLDAALGAAWDQELAPRNACRGVKVSRPDTIIEPPTLEELELLFAELAADPWLAVFELMRETGARLGEVLGLERRHVDLAARTITYSRQRSGSLKTRASRRTVAIPVHVAELLAGLPVRIDSPLLFTTSTGRPLDQRNVLRHFDNAAERAGIRPSEHADLAKYRPHDLRHAFATGAIEAGVAEPIVAAWLGHSSTAMLKRYAHVRPMPGGAARRRLEAVWLDDLELAFGIRHRVAAAASA